jgi:chorismate dehydratase
MAYINTLPIDWGLVSSSLGKLVELQRGMPTTLNRLLAEGRLDVSPVSSIAAAARVGEWLVLDGLCIGCRGKVGSVILRSERPVLQLHGGTIAVTRASATATRLLELLLKDFWKVDARLVPARESAAAELLIGDPALKAAQSDPSGFVYDLGEAWKDYSGQGFVFGLWCVRRAFAAEYPEETLAMYHLLQASYAMGRSDASRVCIEAARCTGLAVDTVSRYFGHLVYDLDESLWRGLNSFLTSAGYSADCLEIFGHAVRAREQTVTLSFHCHSRPENAFPPLGCLPKVEEIRW